MADLNLDELIDPVKTVQIGGKDYECAPYDLASSEKFAELKKQTDKADSDLGADLAATRALFALILPTCPAEVLDKLGMRALRKLTLFWIEGLIAETEKQEGEAKEVLAHPTPPG